MFQFLVGAVEHAGREVGAAASALRVYVQTGFPYGSATDQFIDFRVTVSQWAQVGRIVGW